MQSRTHAHTLIPALGLWEKCHVPCITHFLLPVFFGFQRRLDPVDSFSSRFRKEIDQPFCLMLRATRPIGKGGRSLRAVFVWFPLVNAIGQETRRTDP